MTKPVMDKLVEQAARAICQIYADRTDETWMRYRRPDSWKQFEPEARAALSTLPADEGLREALTDSIVEVIQAKLCPIFGPGPYDELAAEIAALSTLPSDGGRV